VSESAGARTVPAVRALLLAEFVSLVGDRIVAVALVVQVYAQSGSAASVAVLLTVRGAAALLLGGPAGAVVDRWNRQWIMVGCNLVQAVLVLALSFVDGLPALFGLYLTMSVVNQLFIPARAATIPELVADRALASANALFGAAFVAALAVGPALGGWIVERHGVSVAYGVDAVTFVVPAVVVALLRLPDARTRRPSGVGATTAYGWAFVRSRPALRSALVTLVGAYLAIGVTSVLGIVVARDGLDVGAAGYGVLMSAMGAGMLAGAVLVGRRRGSGSSGRTGAGGLLVAGAALSLLPGMHTPGPALALSALLGLGVLASQVSAQSTLQRVPEAIRGRVLGLGQSATGLAQVLATSVTGLLTAPLGASAVLAGTGVLVAIVGAVGLARPARTESVDAR
jgi:MFS family permease